jgi:hypothetical protein
MTDVPSEWHVLLFITGATRSTVGLLDINNHSFYDMLVTYLGSLSAIIAGIGKHLDHY